MKTATFFLFAVFLVAAECASVAYTNSRLGKRTPVSRSSVFFNKDGTNVAYSINHKPSAGIDASVSITRNVPARSAVPVPAIRVAPAIIPRPVSVKAPVDLPVQLPFYAPVHAPAVPATQVVLNAPVVQQINPISVGGSPAVSNAYPVGTARNPPIPTPYNTVHPEKVPGAYPVGMARNPPIPTPYNTVPHNNDVDAYRMADPFAFGPLPFELNHPITFVTGF
ncbi:BCL-6 corepressor-like protein 1 [Daphnia carinata]|uniref:BCL-6 corepressor-like protein 1 n=1 Tax=Daphnia carinata TaxID=120202 RepID=UPI00257D7B33|nr:BCL-6 corepressor-like protein 1 [Daphnia carinata]